MIGRKVINVNVKWDYPIHRYRHSKSACKARRYDKKIARKLDRIQNKKVDESIIL